MAQPRKVIITCAVTGSIHTPSMSPYLPITAEQIADAAIGAAEAGAAIVHLHAREPDTGKPDQSPQAFEPFLKVIRQRSDVVLNITTGGSQTMTIEDRLRPAVAFKPEVASLNMGTMNFGLYPMLGRYPDLLEWERDYLEGTRNGFFRNTLGDIENILRACSDNGTRYQAALLHPERFWYSGRHRKSSAGYFQYEADGRQAVWNGLPLVGHGRRRGAAQGRVDRCIPGRQCPGRA